MAVAGAEMRAAAEEVVNGGLISGVTQAVKERTRIYVGGLGESVTEDDLRKTFSTLGEIESVEIVRTKGRSFSYLDFIPSSEKSLPKLFSTYNGCMWKGGRLRLEKAKEHHLIRMKREWQEEAQNASDASKDDLKASEQMVSLVKPKKSPSSDKMQLQIFFPKLRKVKSVPWSGTGKHKYSFQRVQVPDLPLHFCDCEEHYVPPITKAKHSSNLEEASGGINEEELSIMNSVMNRLLNKEDLSKTAVRELNLPNERDSFDKSNDDVVVGDEEEEMTNEEEDVTDEDDMIINVVTRGNNRVEALEKESMEAIMAEQISISKKLQTSKDKSPQNISDSQKKKPLPPSKRQKKSDSEETVINIGKSLQLPLTTQGSKALEREGAQQVKITSSRKQKSPWKNLIDKEGSTQFSLTDIIRNNSSEKEDKLETDDIDVPSITNKKEEKPETVNHNMLSTTDKNEGDPKTTDLEIRSITEKHGDGDIQPGQLNNLEDPSEAPAAKPKEASNKVARGSSWLAKSSWTQLVSSTINTPFSLSQVLPSLASSKHDQVQENSSHGVNSAENSSSILKPVGNEVRKGSSDASGLVNKDVISAQTPLSSSVMIQLIKHDNNPASLSSEQKFPEEKLKEKSKVHASSPEKTQPSTSKQTALGEFEFSETCPFMRTDSSMKEWRKRKVSESTSLRKKKKGDME